MLPLKDNVPTRTFPVVTVGIIVVNVIVWIWEFTGTSVETDVIHYGYYPCKIDGQCLGPALGAEIPWYENTFTSMFMHGGWEHIIFNMLFLWIFGNNVEDALGKARFFLCYIAGWLTAIFFILIFFQELPAIFFLGFWFLFQLWQGGFSVVQPEAGGGVAFFAHIGGFVFGALTVRLVAVRRPLMPKY